MAFSALNASSPGLRPLREMYDSVAKTIVEAPVLNDSNRFMLPIAAVVVGLICRSWSSRFRGIVAYHGFVSTV